MKIDKEYEKKKKEFNILFQEKQQNAGLCNQMFGDLYNLKDETKNLNKNFECNLNVKNVLSGIEDFEVSTKQLKNYIENPDSYCDDDKLFNMENLIKDLLKF